MVSCEDLFAESAGLSTSASQEGTLRSLRRSQLSRSRSGGIFSNPFRNERDKMDQLTDILNFFSLTGIPELTSTLVLSKCRDGPGEEESLYLEEHWNSFVAESEVLDRKTQHQQDAIWELLQTEVFYIKRLRVVT